VVPHLNAYLFFRCVLKFRGISVRDAVMTHASTLEPRLLNMPAEMALVTEASEGIMFDILLTATRRDRVTSRDYLSQASQV
jgi:hypothetical protein